MSHGFVRSSNDWTVIAVNSLDNEVSITLQITDNPGFRELWDHAFTLQITTRLFYKQDIPTLSQSMEVLNNNQEKSFTFTAALHTYFTANVEDSLIGPLLNVKFEDKVTKTNGNYQKEYLNFEGQTDIIFYNAPLETTVFNQEQLKLTINRNESFSDVVVWNMWSEKAKTMTDFGEEEWRSYLCVESAIIGNPVHLGPGENWVGYHEIVPNLN